MKILIIISSYPTGEHTAGLFLPDLIDALILRGCQVHVLTQNCEGMQTEYRVVRPGYELTLFGWRGGFTPLVSLLHHGPRGFLLAAQYMRNGIATGVRLVRDWKPDFIFAEWLIPAGFIARRVSRRTGVPYAARALGSDVMLAGRNPLLRMALEWVARGAAVLFADGYDLCRRTSALAGGRPCHFTATVRRLDVRRGGFEPEPDDGTFSLICVGRLHRTKGQDVLLEALALLKQRGVTVRAYLVGAGEECANLLAQRARLGLEREALLTGRLEDGDLLHLLGQINVAVVPSRSESIPLVLREAVAAERPVVVTDVGDMGQLVRDYHLGLVVPPEDAAALATALEQLRTQPHQPDAALRRQYLALFDVQQAADLILAQLRQASGVAGAAPCR
jgi:glycosyltransferase involved in cell wall biosynthesis